LDAVPEVLGHRNEGGLVVASIRFHLTLRRCIKTVRDQVEKYPRDVLGKYIGLASSRIKKSLQCDVEALLFGARPVPGEIEAFLDEALISTTRCSPEPSRECSSMFLTMASARLPCCTILSRLPRNVCISSVISPRFFSLTFKSASASRNSSIISADNPEKLLTKLSGFLISCAIPAVS